MYLARASSSIVTFCVSTLQDGERIPIFLLIVLLSLELLSLEAALPAYAAEGPQAKTVRPHMLPGRSLVEALEAVAAGDSAVVENAWVRGRVFARGDTVHGRLIFSGVRFLDNIALDGVVLADAAVFEDCEFRKGASFIDTHFEAPTAFRRCRFQQHTSFKQARFAEVDFEHSRFAGPATFDQTRFSRVSFAHTQFDDAYFTRATFARSADFTDAEIQLESSFKEASFIAEAIFEGTRFGELALFRDCRFSGPARFDRARFRREALFNRGDFSDAASFRDITFVHGCAFNEARFAGDVTFAGSRFKADLDMSGATIGSALYLNAVLSGDLILHDVSASRVDLSGYAAAPADSVNAANPAVYLEGARFDNVRLSWPPLRGRIAARDSADIAPLAEVYALLIHHLREGGYVADADAVAVEWSDRRRRSLSWTTPRRYLLELFNLTTRYGNSLMRLIASGGGVVMVFAVVFWFARRRFLPTGAPLEPTATDCLLISVGAFVHLRSTAWRVSGALGLLHLLEGVVGWLFWAAIVAVGLRLLLRGMV